MNKKDKKGFIIKCCDGVVGLKQLENKSIKLLYGSPPYPNAERNYGNWTSNNYIKFFEPFIEAALPKMKDDGFIVINIKANREKSTSTMSSRRSLIVEKLAILLEEKYGLYCVDIEIWCKDNPVPTGLRVACQDAYEQNLWFSISPKCNINLDAIRRPYNDSSLKTYENTEFKPRTNGVSYVRKNKKIEPNPLGALPINVIHGAVSSRQDGHQAIQPLYLPEKYIKAVTKSGDLVVDPWVGSGTTGISAIRLDRRFIGFDIHKEFAKLANSNIEKTWSECQMHAKLTNERIELQHYFLDCLGEKVTYYSDIGLRPLEFDLNMPNNVRFRAYIFPATNPPGGRSKDEYKSTLDVPGQKAGQKGNFDWSDSRIVLLVSYVKEFDVFVLFDANSHNDFSFNKNIQMKVGLFAQAIANGIQRYKRTNGEIIFACSSENLVECIRFRKNEV